jgi:rare lipoprotein A (peptidoglycan hydrolase)
MRGIGSVLFVLLLSACAHEPSTPTAIGPQSGGSALHGQSFPEGDADLAEKFQSAPALATLEGEASFYSDRLNEHYTASGELYRPREFTAAHLTLPLGTILRVSRLDGTRTVYVRVNDRGPFGKKGRILDLSRAAAEQLDMLQAGVLEVRAEVVAYSKKKS